MNIMYGAALFFALWVGGLLYLKFRKDKP